MPTSTQIIVASCVVATLLLTLFTLTMAHVVGVNKELARLDKVKLDCAVFDERESELTTQLGEMNEKAEKRARYVHEMRHEMNGNLQPITIALWLIAEKLQIKLPPAVKSKIQDMGDNLG